MEFKGTKRKISIDPYDKNLIFLQGFTLDHGNIDVWVNEKGQPGEIVTQAEAKIHAEMIAIAFEISQKYGSLSSLLIQHKEALNALRIAKDFVERSVKQADHDPILNALINRAIKKEIKG